MGLMNRLLHEREPVMAVVSRPGDLFYLWATANDCDLRSCGPNMWMLSRGERMSMIYAKDECVRVTPQEVAKLRKRFDHAKGRL